MLKGVVLAAGLGSRLNPLTATRPKHLLPIAGKPILEHIIVALKEAGVEEIGVVVHYFKEKIAELLGSGEKYGVKITYIEQGGAKGTAHAIMAAKNYVGSEIFVVVYGDVTARASVIREALKLHEEVGAAATMVSVEVEDPWNYGVLSIDENGLLVRVVEKPKRGEEPSNLINAGIYVLDGSKVFQQIERTPISPRGEIEFTDTLQLLVNRDEKVAVLRTSREWWFDIGRPWDLLDANKALLKELAEREGWMGGVKVDASAKIEDEVELVPPVVIGRGCVVKRRSVIGPNTVLCSGVTVGVNCKIENTIILSRSNIGNSCKISHSIVGGDCVVESDVEFRSWNPDGSNIFMTIKGVRVDSGRKKMGSVVGDYSFIGRGAVIAPGTSIFPWSVVPRRMLVFSDVHYAP
ncbi:MAG: hypothetical protein DRJ20_02680 [Candidatus Methanomethylicota archaeon]|uniref:Uncharacterized protein n=1 Tax=Thermoproteota archaeon TaxID=2056631 RepID=A0A497EUI8_9CREN|nr:MAG: hypothetical protein DRJ20_02680 [Candidatus Verstraetearchaeota archaeon]